MNTLAPLACTYVDERRARSEITDNTAAQLHIRLASFCRCFAEAPLAALDEQAVLIWLAVIGRLEPASRRAYFSTVRRFCRWLLRRGHIAVDPTMEIERIRLPHRVPRALPAAKVAQLLYSRPALRDQAILWLMVGDGLRCSEVGGLVVDDFDPVAATLFVRGKASKERVVPVPATTAHALHRYLDAVGWKPGPMIRPENRRSGHLLGASISDMVTAWMYAAGVKRRARDGVSPHALRHTFASDVLDKTGDLLAVRDLLGHENLATTQIYLRVTRFDVLREAVEGRLYQIEVAA